MRKTNGKAEVSPLATILANVASVPHDEDAMNKWPTLWACLTPVWQAGKCKRQSGRLALRISGSWFIVTLSCPTEAVQTSVSSQCLGDLFDRLEAHLRNPGCQWEPDWESAKKTRQVRIDSLKSD